MVFFDNNATTPILPDAKAAWMDAVDDLWLNPSSSYRAASRVYAHLEKARERLAEILGLNVPGQIVFNSGATEGNNAVFAWWSECFGASAVIAVSPTEHPSVLESAKKFFCDRIIWFPLTTGGSVDLEASIKIIKERQPVGVSAMAANNETGVLNPWIDLAKICRESGVLKGL